MNFVSLGSRAFVGSIGGGVRGCRLGDGDLGFWGLVGSLEILGSSSKTAWLVYFGTGGLFDSKSCFLRRAFGGDSEGGVRDADLVA
jgi:hypothetical protein